VHGSTGREAIGFSFELVMLPRGVALREAVDRLDPITQKLFTRVGHMRKTGPFVPARMPRR